MFLVELAATAFVNEQKLIIRQLYPTKNVVVLVAHPFSFFIWGVSQFETFKAWIPRTSSRDYSYQELSPRGEILGIQKISKNLGLQQFLI